MRAFQQVVGPDHRCEWVIDFGLKRHLLGNQPFFLRIKFFAAQTNATGQYLGSGRLALYNSPVAQSYPQSLAANTYHEIQINGGNRPLLDEQGLAGGELREPEDLAPSSRSKTAWKCSIARAASA